MTVRDVLADLVDLVLPRECVGCGAPGAPLCPSCEPRGAVRVATGLPVPAAAAADYDAAVRAAILAYKERGRRDLARPLGVLLARAVDAVARAPSPVPLDPAVPGLVLIPVPSAPAAARARGGDHVRRLAETAAARLRRGGLAVRVDVPLRLRRAVADSSGLGAAARAANLYGAHGARTAPRVAPPAVLVDDVATTGATLREGVRALTAAGWRVRGAAVVAATPLHRPRRGVDTRGTG